MKQNLRFRGSYCPKRIQPVYLLFTIFLLTGVGGKGAFGQGSIKESPTDTIKTIRDTLVIEEIEINAGYYTTTRRTSTGNISRIDAETISKQPVLNVMQALQATASGVFVQQRSGVPGDGFAIQLRGQNSLRATANEPLYVIDGVPFSANPLSTQSVVGFALNSVHPLNMISPDAIEHIEILKDADATAIYGSRGANGVILITTKRGKRGARGGITLNTYWGSSKADRLPALLETLEYLEMRKEAFANDGVTPTIQNAPDLMLWDTTRYTDWQRMLVGNGAGIHNIQLGLTGGQGDLDYTLDINDYSQGTVFPGDFRYRRRSVNLGVSQSMYEDRLQLRLNLRYTNDRNRLPANDPSRMVLNLLPHAPRIRDDEGRYNFEGGTFANPIALLSNTYSHGSSALFSSAFVKLRIIPGLFLNASVGYTDNTLTERNLETVASQNPAISPVGTAIHGMGKTSNWIVEPWVSYTRNAWLGRLELLTGTTFQRDDTDKAAVRATGYRSDELLENRNAATALTPYGSTLATYRYLAVYGRANYTFMDRYILNLTGRMDGSSRFGPGKKTGAFGAVGAAWLFSKEGFMAGVDWLSHGKLRASVGVTGSDQIGDFQYMGTYSATVNTYNGMLGLVPTRLVNPEFGWESNRKTEAALELGMLNGAVSLSAAYYIHRSSSQLVGLSLPLTTGFPSIQANLPATVENTGLEVEVDTRILSRGKITWAVSGNLTVPRNRLVDFPDIESSTYANTYRVGLPLSARRAYVYTGIDAQTGIYTFEDSNGDGRINSSDQTVIRGPELRYFGAIRNRMDFGPGISLDFTFRFVKQTGNNFRATANGAPGTRFSNQPQQVMERWQLPVDAGHQAPLQRFTQGNTAALLAYANMRNSDAAVSDASFVRLQNVSLSWQPRHLPGKVKEILTPTIFLQGQNLWTVTRYQGGDPENQTLQALPPLRTVTVGVTLTYQKR